MTPPTVTSPFSRSLRLAFLREQGCDEVQGYLFSQPLPADQFETFVRRFAERNLGDFLSADLLT